MYIRMCIGNQARGLAEKMYVGKSHLITGAGWDRTIGWLVESNNKTMEQVFEDSKDWGNYSNSSFIATGTGVLAKTGAFGNNTKANNIFDLAGNAYELTNEKYIESGDGELIRGGMFNDSGSKTVNVRRTNASGYSVGFRVALFL